MTCRCPACGQTLLVDPLDHQVSVIRAWARDNGVPILLGDCLRRADAATFLGRAEKTLANWANTDGLTPSRYLNARPYYEIRDLAAFILKPTA